MSEEMPSNYPETYVDSWPKKPPFLFATTRGMNSSHKDYLVTIALDADGLLMSSLELSPLQADVQAIHLYETPTRGGKAKARALAP